MKKISTYQRLKVVNQRLREQLCEIVNNPDSPESMLIKAEWKMIGALDKATWFGDMTSKEFQFKGLMPLIL